MKLLDRLYFVVSVVTLVYWYIVTKETSWLNTSLSFILSANMVRSYFNLDDDL